MNDLFTETLQKTILIDGEGHVSGRLAAIVAKLLLNGQFVAVVNCMHIVRSGKLKRNVGIWRRYKHITANYNPRKGAKHHRAPKLMFFRTVRGMVPRKKWRGLGAIRRLRLYDGVPPEFFYREKLVCPTALANLVLKTETARCTLAQVAHIVGWRRRDILLQFEAERKENQAFLDEHDRKVSVCRDQAIQELEGNEEYQRIQEQIESLEIGGGEE